MWDRTRTFFASFPLAMFVVLFAHSSAIAEDSSWRVTQSSGEVWVSASGAQPASLATDSVLNPGDNIRTGRNGRVLLVRGEESILISPNSVIGIPAERDRSPATTIFQRAGSVLISVDKRQNRNFEVKTPHLAAVVKGTQFRIAVTRNDSNVDVLRGQVEVTDFKSGEFVLVVLGQTAKVSAQGTGGLILRGTGTLNPIQHGTPQTSPVTPVQGAKDGRSAQAGPRVRVVTQGEGEPASSSPAGNTDDDTRRGSGVNSLGKLLGIADGRKNRNDDAIFIIAVTSVIGFSVALVVSAQRRRQKKKQMPK